MICFQCVVDWVCWLDDGGDCQYNQGDNFQWCKEIVYGVQQFVWIEGDQNYQCEVNNVVDQQWQWVVVGQWCNIDFKGDGCGMWCCEQWFYCEIVYYCQQDIGYFINWGVQVFNVVVDFCQCYYCQYWQIYCSDQEVDCCCLDVFVCL